MMPNAGSIRIYTSGCPKNQKRCWYSTGSPPPFGSKKDVLKFLSVNNIVIAPAKTGKDNKSKNAVMNTAQTKSGVRCAVMPGDLIFSIVTIKFIAPKIEETPARCKLKIAKSTDPPEWACIPASGGYTVQPVPTPDSTNEEDTNKINEGGNSQKLMLFNLGKAISQAPIKMGTNQLPNPPIAVGITKKNIIRNAWLVTKTLYN